MSLKQQVLNTKIGTQAIIHTIINNKQHTLDIIEYVQLKKSLAESEEKLRVLVETATQAVWETDNRGIIVKDSPSWRAYTRQTLQNWMQDGWLGAMKFIYRVMFILHSIDSYKRHLIILQNIVMQPQLVLIAITMNYHSS